MKDPAIPGNPRAEILTAAQREGLAFRIGILENDLFVSELDFLNLTCCESGDLERWLTESWNEYDIRNVLAGSGDIGPQPWALVDERGAVRLFSPTSAALQADAELEIALAAPMLRPGYKPLTPSELLTWWDCLEQMRRLFVQGCRVWRQDEWHGLGRSQKVEALRCVNEIEQRIPLLGSRKPSHMTVQKTAIQQCMILMKTIAAYLGDGQRVIRFADVIFHQPQWWAALQEAVVECEWLDKRSPIEYLGKVASIKYDQNCPDYGGEDSQGVEHQRGAGGKIRRTDALRQLTITLEEIAEMPDQVLLERRFTQSSIGELLKAASNDAPLAKYVDAVIRNPKWKREDVWASLGLTETVGRAVDRRYRRLRKRLRDLGAGMEWRTVPQPGISEGSQFTVFQVLADGTRGAKFGVTQHKLLITSEK